MIVDKSWYYGHVVVLLLLRSVSDGRMDVKETTNDIQVTPLILYQNRSVVDNKLAGKLFCINFDKFWGAGNF